MEELFMDHSKFLLRKGPHSYKSLIPLLVFLLAGCATSPSLQMSKQDFEKVDSTEGVIVGSVLVEIQESVDESSDSWLKGRKTENFEYQFEVEDLYQNDLVLAGLQDPKRYTVKVVPGQEKAFVAKLPVGQYFFYSIRQLGFSNRLDHIRTLFSVTAGQTTYVGRLVIIYPYRLSLSADFTVQVDDTQEKTVGALKAEFSDQLANVRKGLMTRH
jgi:hypothetical protein